ncbi:MAG: hypothetical protein V1900_04570 [Candidatus Aenigmatarchaeota archaeon]
MSGGINGELKGFYFGGIDPTMRKEIEDILNMVRKVDGIVTVDPVTGPYDFIATGKAYGIDGVNALKTSIQCVKGVTNCLQCYSISAKQ